MTKPTVAELKTKLTERQLYYGPLHERWKICRDFYDGNIPVPVPKSFEKYVPPTARAIVDTIVDHYITQHPVVTVPPSSLKRISQESADKLEKFYNAIIHQNDILSIIPPEREGAKQLGLYGMCVFEGPWIDERYLDDETYFPFRYKPINPFHFFPSPSYFWERSGDVIKAYEKTVSEVKQTWPKWKTARRDTDKVKCIQYVSNEYVMFVADEDVLDDKNNMWGFIPYRTAFNGMGLLTDKPEDMAVGILWPTISALKAEARLKTAADAIVRLGAYPPLKVNFDPASLNIDIIPGSLNYVPEGSRVEKMWELDVPKDIYNNIAMVSDDIEHATMPRIVYGENPPGVTSGYHARTNVSEAGLKFQQGLDGLELAMNDILGNCARLFEKNIPGELTIWGTLPKGQYNETIKGTDIQGHYICNVNLESSKPEENERKALSGLQMYTAGAISLKTYHERYADIADHTGEFKQMLVEGILKQPQILQALASGAAQDWGIDEYIQQEQEKQSKAGNVPQEQMPQSIMGMPTGNPVAPAGPGTTEEQALIQQRMRQV